MLTFQCIKFYDFVCIYSFYRLSKLLFPGRDRECPVCSLPGLWSPLHLLPSFPFSFLRHPFYCVTQLVPAWWWEWVQQWKQMVRLRHTGLLLCPHSSIRYGARIFSSGDRFVIVSISILQIYCSLQVINLHSSCLCFVMPSLRTGHSQNSSTA